MPGLPKFMEKPSLSGTIEFKKSIQLLKSGEDLAPDQAIGLQARAAVKMDSRIEHLNGEERSYLEGAAAGLAVSLLRNQSQMDKLPLLARALTDEYFNVVEDAIKQLGEVDAKGLFVIRDPNSTKELENTLLNIST